MNPRGVALAILNDVGDGAYLNLSMKKHLDGLPPQDRRFAAALVFTTLENKIRIDYVIDAFTEGKRIHKLIRNALELGVCQLMFFESVPASAAVNETVKLVGKSKKRQLKGFTNAVLRNIADNLGEISYPSVEEEPAKYLSIMYSYPEFLCEMYIADYGLEFAWDMLAYKKEDAFTSIRINTLKTNATSLQNKLDGRGYAFIPGRYVQDCLYIENITDIEEMDIYQKGLLTVQGEASMLVCKAAGNVENRDVLDTCAAPGGKSAYMACGHPGEIVAQELHAHRVELMEKNFARLGVQAVVKQQDATVFVPEYESAFDIVLIDAPCSALGLLYRKPDIKHAKTMEDLTALVEVQQKILDICSRYVKPGGRLVYATCTINKRENNDQINTFLHANTDFAPARLQDDLPPVFMPRIKEGQLQLFPHIDGIDGFFMAAMERSI